MKKYFEVSVIAFIVFLALLSPSIMFDNQAVFALLSPGEHTPVGALAFFLIFLVVRLFVLLILPGYCLWRIVEIITRLQKRRKLGD